MEAFYFILGIFIFWFSFAFIADILHYMVSVAESSVKINFKTFIDWYQLNPERYILCDYNIIMKLNEKNEHLYFSTYIDVKRYHFFKRQLEKKEELLKKNKCYKEVLSMVQCDIDMVRNRAQENIDKAQKILEE